ncbi:MAG: hypothetical protein ACJAR1_000809 [Rubritalea sp.]|jgi:hypothetical protein
MESLESAAKLIWERAKQNFVFLSNHDHYSNGIRRGGCFLIVGSAHSVCLAIKSSPV